VNKTFPAVSLTVLAVSALMAACSEPPAPATVVKPVFVTTVTQAASAQTRTFTSVVRARVETDLGFRTGGKVVERPVEVGDAVKAGQVLARLDPADYQLAVKAAADQVQAANVDAQQAASDEARFRRLLADGSVGSADHERQKARADAAAARLDQARRQLELARNREGYATLVAPYAGVVTALRFERGQVVAEGQAVISLARDGEREIVAELPEDWVGRARTLTATATPWHDAPNDARAPLPLVLRELSPLASAQGRTFRVRYAAAPESRAQVAALPLGSTTQLNLSGPTVGPAATAVPVTALVKASASAGVWVLDAKGSGLVFTPVQVVAMDDAWVHVTGLDAGSRVVSVGAQKLDAGITVRAVERAPEAGPAPHSKGSS
jgi:RND family efflux transporter MFP subunit